MPGSLFLTVLFLAVCPIIGWWRWQGVKTDSTTVLWRKMVGLLGLTANTLAIAVPFVACLYQFTRNTYSLNVSMPNFPLIIRFAFFLAVCGLIGGVLAPAPDSPCDCCGRSDYKLGDIGCSNHSLEVRSP